MVSEAETGTEIIEVGGRLMAAVLSVGTHKHHRALEILEAGDLARQGRRRIDVPVAEAVVALGTGNVNIPAKAEVQGQFLRHFPVILHIKTVVFAGRGNIKGELEVASVIGGDSQQEGGETVA